MYTKFGLRTKFLQKRNILECEKLTGSRKLAITWTGKEIKLI